MALLCYVVLIAPALTRPFQHMAGLVAKWRPSQRLLGGLLVCAGLILLYRLTSFPVTLIVDGQVRRVWTHQDRVEGVMREADIRLRPEDLIAPATGSELVMGSVIQVTLARPVIIEADGRSQTVHTQQRRVAEILAEAGIGVKPQDEALINGQVWNLAADLTIPSPREEMRQGAEPRRPDPVRIVLRRAVPVHLSDDGVPVTFYTTQATVGEALLSQGILLYLGDRVSPSLGSRLLPGMRIFLERSTPVTINADGRTLRTRTQHRTVGDVLRQEGVLLMGRDYSTPPLNTPILADMSIWVVRVREALEIEQELIPFETKWIADPNLLIDTQQVVQAGGPGVIKRRFRVTYEDGQELASVMEDEWLDHPPGDKIIAYGTKVVVNTLETPDGPFEYWRHFRVLATSYSAATSGIDASHPHYGVTRTGLKAGYGVIAVDPKVIPLWSEVYVPGYGRAVAGDTGGSILGRHIDLGFDEEIPPLWYRWIDVYLATPAPPADQIRYVLPNWPEEPRR